MSLPQAERHAVRIHDVTMEDPASLLANPQNWRVHPRKQQDALTAIIKDVGFTTPVLVNDVTGHLVDGHMRVMIAMRLGIPLIPVGHLRVNAREERIILATHDPVSAMASTDQDALRDLVGDVLRQPAGLDADLAALLADLGEGRAPETLVNQETPPDTCPCCGRAT